MGVPCFSLLTLAHFRKIGKLVEFEDIPGMVETALALSGSAAQSKIQTFPGDADYFERVNITAKMTSHCCGDMVAICRPLFWPKIWRGNSIVPATR